MIAYQELVAALERWRVRNGLPVGGTALGEAPPASAMPPPLRPSASYGAVAPPPPPMPVVPAPDDSVDLGDADVLEEDLYSDEGGDFAMGFGAASAAPEAPASEVDTGAEIQYEAGEPPTPPPGGLDAYDDDERTAIGESPGGAPPPIDYGAYGADPVPHASPDTFDADEDVISEAAADDDDPFPGS